MSEFSEKGERQSGAARARRSQEGQARERRPSQPKGGENAASLKDAVAEIDRDILRLLLRRHNLLEKMRGGRAALVAADEKFLRESWQKAVSRVSHDADLSGRFFALMQDATFLPRVASSDSDARDADAGTPAPTRGADRREAFNLAPQRKPVQLSLTVPLDCRKTRAWLFLAAATGQAVRLSPCLMNDPLVDLVKALNQLGAQVTREQDAIVSRQAQPLGRPDKVVYVGDSLWNLFLLLAFYLARPSRIKFLGETELKLADLSSLRHFLPQLGARFTNVIPRSSGLPARLECSGIMPARADLPPDVPAALGAALLLAAPFFEREFTLGLEAHPQAAEVLAFALPLLRQAQVSFTQDKDSVSVQPGQPQLASQPQLPMDLELAAFLLALVMPLGGEARLAGLRPRGPEADAAWEALRALGLPLALSGENGEAVGVKLEAPKAANRLSAVPPSLLASLPDSIAPLPLALAACAALRGEEADAPHAALAALRCPAALAADFFAATGLELEDEKLRLRAETTGSKAFVVPVWNAPSPAWALALALAACARPERCQGFKLGNPGILTQLYPGFWALYNGLPRPQARQAEEEPPKPALQDRRRIRTALAAVLPPESGAEEC